MGEIVGLLFFVFLLFGLILFTAGLVGLILVLRRKRLRKDQVRKKHRAILIATIAAMIVGVFISIPGFWLGAQIIPFEIYDAKYSKTIEYAADTNNYQEVKRLLESGVSPDECFSNGTYTPLMHASTIGDGYDVAKLLLEHKANPNLEFGGYGDGSDKGYTALMYAVDEPENLNLVKLLVEYGADVNHVAADGKTPLKEAEYFNSPEFGDNSAVVNYLKSVGAK